jgi:hypothetical protein
MSSSSKLGSILALILALSACGVRQQASQPPPAAASVAPAMLDTPSLPPTKQPNALTPAPALANLQMYDAMNGWGWTTAGRVLHTRDGGLTWADRTPVEGVGWDKNTFLDSQTAWQLIGFYDSDLPGLLHTSDGGQTWMQISNGPQGPFSPATILHFADARNGWAESVDVGAGNAYYSLSETHDGGKTWAPIPILPPEVETGLPVGTIHLCNICGDSLYYDPERTIIVSGDMGSMESAGVVRTQISIDLGTSWQVRNLALPESVTHALVTGASPTFFDDKNGLLAVNLMEMSQDGNTTSRQLVFYITHDGGADWSLLPGILDNVSTFPQLQVTSARELFALCVNALCASHDGAQSWQVVTSNLDLTQTDTRSVQALDFIDASTGWVLIQEDETTSLHRTTDGGVSWSLLTPRLAASEPVRVTLDESLPTPTRIPTPTPDIVFDAQANAERVRFAQDATWMELSGSLAANGSQRYVLSAMQGQVMSVSVQQGPGFTVEVSDAGGKLLSDMDAPRPFWRGILPSTQDYILTVSSQVSGPFSLRVAINPPGKVVQDFEFVDPQFSVSLSYTDEFAPMDLQVPINARGTPLLTLSFIDPSFYSPGTNLSEAYLLLAASSDPAIVSICTQPFSGVAEVAAGQVSVNNIIFTRGEFSGAAAGNRYDQVSYRSVWKNQCFEVITLVHSTNIGNYPPGTVTEYDQPALLGKFEAILNTFQAR